MASEDDIQTEQTEQTDQNDQPAEQPAKRAARKRAPRKATAAAALEPDTTSEPAAEASGEAQLALDPPAPRKRTTKAVASKSAAATVEPDGSAETTAPKKSATKKAAEKKAAEKKAAPQKATAPESLVDEDALRFDALAAPDTADAADPAGLAESVDAAEAAGGFAPVFQAPATRRRRASSPTSAPSGRRRATAEGTDSSEAAADSTRSETGEPGAPPDEATAAQPSGIPAEAESDSSVQRVGPDADDDPAAAAESPRRRRRRGGKGRRGRAGEQAAEADSAAPAETGDETDGGALRDAKPEKAPTADDEGDTGSTSRRRTRRRRRSGGGSDADQDDTAGVTTKVRDSRRDEVTALKGSTRLEAKKQRRREGREAGRRRTIITEAEFLARRESVERVMVVRHLGDRTQIAVLEDGVLVEHYISKETSVSMAGNIYLGKVQNVLPSMEAAFVDIGKGRNAVLYAGEVNWDAAGLESNQPKRIESALSSGESVLVQVTKDPLGHKGARLTSQISLPGRYLVYVPNSSMTGISRKLPDTERARLKKILREVVPETAGVIVRTAAEGASEEELRADVERLTQTWDDITAKAESASGSGSGKKKSKSSSAPLLLHGEPDLTVRVIRDIFNEDFASLVVAGERAWQEVSDYVGSVAPDLAERITRWTSEEDLFTHYRVDEQIAKAMDRKVWLPSGGSLVIDRTEAMTVVDVNTGKFIGSGGNLEETVTKNNLEAAEEIVRQLRLRDVGGIIVIDFIDMVLESNRDLVVRRLLECLGRDRTKHQVAEVTSLGLVQMTRKRVGSGLIEVFSETCDACAGRGIIIHSDPVDKSSNGYEHGEASGMSSTPGRSRSRTPEPVAPARPSGPTPAQIAAAAHAAAIKTGIIAGADTAAAQAEVSAFLADLPVLEDEPVDVVIEMDTLEPGSLAAADPAPVGTEPVLTELMEPEPESAPVPEQAVAVAAAYEPVLTAPANGRPRRHRGRVVAPAGPPPASVHPDPSQDGGI